MQLLMPALGGESVYEADLPACCARAARGATSEDGWAECYSCGAMWQVPLPVAPGHDSFARWPEHRGAA